ncbi:MAG: signal peptide peptidase SppA [Armatimonadota bacterium]
MKQTAWVVAGVVLAFAALVGAALVGGALGFVAGATGGFAGGGGGPGGSEHVLDGQGPDKIAVIPIVGPITREGSDFLPIFGSGASSRWIVRQLDRAQHDDAVKAVILELDTPGGSVVASDEVHQKLGVLRRAGKPIVALMTETAASGGYYIAAGAHQIIADPSTITGSIGVIVALLNVQDLNRKIGIRTLVFKSGAFKDIGNPDRPTTPQEAAIFQRLVNEAYSRFVDIVAQGRRMDRAKVRRLADGRIYTGQQALRLGLVDSLGHLPEAIAAAKKRAGLTDAQVIEYGTDGILRSLLGSGMRRIRFWRGPGDASPRAQEPFSVQYLMVP